MGSKARIWAGKHLKGNKWNVWSVLLVIEFIFGIASGVIVTGTGSYEINNQNSLSLLLESALSILMLPMTIGMVFYLINLVHGKKFDIEQIFSKYSDIIRIFLVNVLKSSIVTLYTLLLIIPGIIKSIEYALTDYILADDDFNDLKTKEVLDLSKELMNGHKMEYFMLYLYYTLMIFLGVLTLGILWIWTIPEMTIANVKFATLLFDEYKEKQR